MERDHGLYVIDGSIGAILQCDPRGEPSLAQPSPMPEGGEKGPLLGAYGQFSCAKPVGAQKSFPTARYTNQSGRPGIGSSLPHCGQAT